MANDFVLYILMRKDMESLDHAGKLIAQGAHAANMAAELIGRNTFSPTIMAQFAEWQKQTPSGFGTTIVFGGKGFDSAYPLKIDDIKTVTEFVGKAGFASGIVTDPGYPLRDGKTMHSFPCETCGWIFGSKQALTPYLDHLRLHQASAYWSEREGH